jgi:hypothetical protein
LRREVKNVNKKILVIVVALMAVAMMASPLVGMVYAGKGEEKLPIEFYVGGLPGSQNLWFSPNSDNPDVDPQVGHVRGATWNTAVPIPFKILVGEAGSVETITNAYIVYSLLDQVSNRNLKTNDATLKIREVWMIYSDTDHTNLRGTIEILAVETLTDVGGPNYSGQGSFVAHGTIDGQAIKLSGEAGITLPPGPFRIGTVMGWP